MFLFIFEIYLNIFAELTNFADRKFYDDFWNSIDF
jgi:sterol O-acyltransferase